MNDYGRKYRAKQRQVLIDFLGSRCNNTACGFTDIRALQIDHKHGGGTQDYERNPPHIRRAHIFAHPEEYQILCANCNWIKKAEQNENATRPLSAEHRLKISTTMKGRTRKPYLKHNL